MDSYLLAAVSAIWLGILTSISPCPLATNIAAISYIGKQVGDTRMVLLSGMLYIFGRMLAYLALGILIIASVLSVPKLSFFLQNNLNKILGPVLILAGLFLLSIENRHLRSRHKRKNPGAISILGDLGSSSAGDCLCAFLLPDLGRPLFRKPDSAFAET